MQLPFDGWYCTILASIVVITMTDSNYSVNYSNFRILNLLSGCKLLTTEELALQKFVSYLCTYRGMQNVSKLHINPQHQQPVHCSTLFQVYLEFPSDLECDFSKIPMYLYADHHLILLSQIFHSTSMEYHRWCQSSTLPSKSNISYFFKIWHGFLLLISESLAQVPLIKILL